MFLDCNGSSCSCRSSGSGTQPAGISNEPSVEPSNSGESGKAKRKKPTPNLDAIDDPQERRKQRRLAKNRATAAVSRCSHYHAAFLPESCVSMQCISACMPRRSCACYPSS